MQYTITENKKRLEISNERGQSMGVMEFDTWKQAKANITGADGNIYNITSIGFWKSNLVVTINSLPYAEITTKVGKGFIISFTNGHSYFLRKKSFWNSREYIVTDNAESQVASIRTTYKWRKFNFNYEVEINEQILPKEVVNSLPFLLVYCIRLMNMSKTAAI